MRIGALGTYQLAGASLGGAPPPISVVIPPVNLYGHINNPLNVPGEMGALNIDGQAGTLIAAVGGVGTTLNITGCVGRPISITGKIWNN